MLSHEIKRSSLQRMTKEILQVIKSDIVVEEIFTSDNEEIDTSDNEEIDKLESSSSADYMMFRGRLKDKSIPYKLGPSILHKMHLNH